ncbi:hypothetical protein Tco_0754198 [Tanacetum coccineum]
MENSKRRSIPMQDKLRLSKSQGASTPTELKRMQNVPYASAVGSIMYDVRCTCPDVAFAQNITSQFQQNLGDLHWTTVKNILKYLMSTKDMFLTRYVFVLNGGAVDWKSAKQSIFATSSAEVKYITAYDASKETVWVRKFISGLGVVPIIEKPISIYCDNTGAITIANESGITKGARHFRAKVHYLREAIEFGDIKLEKVHTYDNLADPFTKALAFPKHSEHTRNIGMLPARSSSAWMAYMNARVAGLFLLVLLEYPNGKGVVRATSRELDMAPHWSGVGAVPLMSPSKAKSFEGCRSSVRMTMHEVVHEMVVGECHKPNSEGSGFAWMTYMNARVDGLFLLVLLEYPNAKGVVRTTSRGLDMAPHWSGVGADPMTNPRQDETSEPLLYARWMVGPYRCENAIRG